MLLNVFIATFSPIATIVAVVMASRLAGKKLTSIEVKVDGRLEAALEKIDMLQSHLSTATGNPAPPPVAGQDTKQV